MKRKVYVNERGDRMVVTEDGKEIRTKLDGKTMSRTREAVLGIIRFLKMSEETEEEQDS